MVTRVRILVQFTIYRRLLIGRDGRLDQSEAYESIYRNLSENTAQVSDLIQTIVQYN